MSQRWAEVVGVWLSWLSRFLVDVEGWTNEWIAGWVDGGLVAG